MSTYEPIGMILKRMAPDLASQSTQRQILFVLATLCALLPLDITHLLSLFAGAAAFILLQRLQPEVAKPDVLKHNKAVKTEVHKVDKAAKTDARKAQKGLVHFPVPLKEPPQPLDTSTTEVRKPSAHPILAPTFASQGWDEQIQELLKQITPTAEAEAAVARIAGAVEQAIRTIFPEADVTGFASGSLVGRHAFGVAVPEVDIVVNVSPRMLVNQSRSRCEKGQNKGPVDYHKLQKTAVRMCTDCLVSLGVLKFRRSAFRDAEPKVTMMAPPELCLNGQSVPLNMSVNTVTPFYSAALLTECGQIEPRAKELILLVKRWAKDRALCHAAKGHLPPYAWTLLTVFYLQVGTPGGVALLPALDQFRRCSQLLKKKNQAVVSSGQQVSPRPALSVFALFRGFVIFYAKRFKLSQTNNKDNIIAFSRQTAQSFQRASVEMCPFVEDPFEEGRNLAESMTPATFVRLQEELHRAQELCSDASSSLSTLLQPWAPPEQQVEAGMQERDLD